MNGETHPVRVNPRPQPVWTCDDLIIGDTAKGLLRASCLLPSSWGIPAAEWPRIKAQNIFITVTTLPAGTLLVKNRLKGIDDPKLVMIELSRVRNHELTQQEVVAMILHEIGHIVNPPPAATLGTTDDVADMLAGGRTTAQRQELFADDYARHCEKGEAVASGLERLMALQPNEFSNQDVRRRIQRIRVGEHVNRNLAPIPAA